MPRGSEARETQPLSLSAASKEAHTPKSLSSATEEATTMGSPNMVSEKPLLAATREILLEAKTQCSQR